jgi:hypothetical protein
VNSDERAYMAAATRDALRWTREIEARAEAWKSQACGNPAHCCPRRLTLGQHGKPDKAAKRDETPHETLARWRERLKPESTESERPRAGREVDE